jgi:hypothetical protein
MVGGDVKRVKTTVSEGLGIQSQKEGVFIPESKAIG